MKKLLLLMVALMSVVNVAVAQQAQTVIAQWQFTASWYFGILPDYEVIQPIRLIDTNGNDVTSQCLEHVTFTSSATSSISAERVPAGHNSGMTDYWKLKAGQTKGNAVITASYNGQVQWNQNAITPFTVFCGDPTDPSWQQNNLFGIDPIMVFANQNDVFGMPTITVNGNRNVLSDFDILAVRSSNTDNVQVIDPLYNNAGVLLHGYQFRVLNTTPTRIWIEIKGKGQFQGYWAKIYFNVNGYTVKNGEATGNDPNADVPVGPMGEGGSTPVTPSASYSVKIPVPNYVLAAGQTIHQAPGVKKTMKDGEKLTTTDVTDQYTFAYTCDRPDYAYVAADGTVTALKEIKEPVYINVRATPTSAGKIAGCLETSTSYSIQIYSSESVIRLNPTELTIPMRCDTIDNVPVIQGEKRLVPSIIMKVNGSIYEPNQENTYDLSYEGFNPTIVTLIDEDGKRADSGNGFDMKKVQSFLALKPGTTQGIVHARGKGINSGFWGTAPFSITVTPYVAPVKPDTPTPVETSFREISIPVPFYTMAYGNTIHQRIKVKEFANAETKKNNQYTDVTNQYILSYSSSNNQTATVNDKGLVTAVAENVNPVYITVTATPTGDVPAVNQASFGVKIFGGASVISPSRRNISVAPNEMVPVPGINVVVDGIQYSAEDAFNLHYDVTGGTEYAEVITNSNIRGKAEGTATVTVRVVGKGQFEGFYGTTQFDVIVRQSETLDGANTWYWAQDGARSAIYDLYPGKQLHFEFTNHTINTDVNKSDAGWTFIASKTPDYSDQAFLAANPFANLMTWDGWGENANPQPVVTLPGGDFNLETYRSDLQNAHVDYIVSLGQDGKTMTVHATIQAKDSEGNVVRTYHYDIDNKQLSYPVNTLPVYFSSVRSTIESLRLIPQTYTVTVAANDGGTVKVMVNGEERQNQSKSFQRTFNDIEEGSRVTVMAMPNAQNQEIGKGRYFFVKWEEDKNTEISRDFYIDHNITLTANFHQDENKWLNVTQDGQTYIFSKANYDNDFYFKVMHGENVHAETEWALNQTLQQTLTSLYGDNDHHIDLYVRGANAFKIYAFDANGVESQYTVSVDGGDAKTVAHHGTALETSQLFSISTPVAVGDVGDGFNTISLKANDSELHPYMIVFYTKEPIQQTDKRMIATLANNTPVTVNDALANGGTLSTVTYANNQDKEIADVQVVGGKLQVTGKKAGNIIVKLNFTGDQTHSAATFDYTVVVRKRDVRLSWNKKSINLHISQQAQSRASQDWSQFAVLHYSEFDINGDTIWDKDAQAPTGVNVNFTSTNPDLLTYQDGHYTFGGTEGTTDLIAQIAEDDQFLHNSATVCINVTSHGGIYYEVSTKDQDDITTGMQKDLNDTQADRTPVVVSLDMHVYKYNNKLDEPVGDKVAKTTKDVWGEVKEYQGSDAMKKVWYIDGYSFNTQGNQNAMNELFRSETASDYRILWTDDQFSRIHPFSLPVRGSFVKFEAVKSGTLTAYVLQNGNFNFNHISEYEDKKNNPFSKKPRLYYWFDQEGNNLQSQVTATTQQPLAVGRRNDLPELTKVLADQVQSDPEIAELYQKFPSQWDVDRNQEKSEPDAQPIIEYHGGYTIMNKAYMKYQLPVLAGNTYYFFSNDSKVAFAGVSFQPGEPAAARQDGPRRAYVNDNILTLTESDDWSSKGMQEYKGKSFEHVTLTRKFTKNQWNTICLPFNVSEKQVEDVFGVGTQLIIYNGIKNVEGQNIAQFLRHVDQNILAGQPYFIYPTKDITTLNFTDVTIPTDLQVRSYGNDDEDGLKMVGTLSQTDVARYDYYVNTNTGAITRYTGAGTKLNAYRAFLHQTNPAQGRTFNFGFTDIEAEAEDVVTGLEQVIQDLGVTTNIHQDIYTLDGRRINNSNIHGIRIINGTKNLK